VGLLFNIAAGITLMQHMGVGGNSPGCFAVHSGVHHFAASDSGQKRLCYGT
jgi:hypothetical protein